MDAIQEFLGIDVAADGGFFKPFDRFDLVFFDTLSAIVHVAEESGGIDIARFGTFG